MRLVIITALAALSLVGCQERRPYYGTTGYGTSTSCGTTSTPGVVGGLAGAAGGGLLGNQFGKGKGKAATTAGGALAGGAGGYEAGRSYSGC